MFAFLFCCYCLISVLYIFRLFRARFFFLFQRCTLSFLLESLYVPKYLVIKQNVAIMENMMNNTNLKHLHWVVLHIE